MKKLLSITAAALALLASSAAFGQDFTKFIDKPAPAFKLTTVDGKVLTNASTRGKALLIDMWATWCGPCKAASPTMQKLHTTYAGKGLMVIGAIVMDGKGAELKTKAAGYKKAHKYSYHFATGGDPLAEKMGVRGIPFFVFIDKKGIVREVKMGFSASTSPAEFEAIVKRILK